MIDPFTIAMIIQTVIKLAPLIIETLEKLGLFDEDVSPEELGARKLLAEEDGYSLDQFDSGEEYLTFLKDYKIDEERAAKFTDNELVTAGFKVMNEVLKEKYDMDLTGEAGQFLEKNGDFFSSDRLVAYLETFKDSGTSLSEFAKVASGEVQDSDGTIVNAAVTAEKALNPDKSDEDIMKQLTQLKT